MQQDRGMPHLKLDPATYELVPGQLGALNHVRQWKALAKYSSYQGHRLFYVDSGEGETMLCLHGFPLTSWSWGRIWPRLSRSYRMLSFDYLGTGYSDKPVDHAYSVADNADQVLHLLDELGINRVHILAHGGGVSVAEELMARTRSELSEAQLSISNVIFLNGSIVPSYKMPFARQLREAIADRGVLDRADEVLFGRLMNMLCSSTCPLNPQFIHETWFMLKRKEGIHNIKGLMHYLSDRDEYADRWEASLKDTDIRIDCILGLADPVWGEKMMPALRRNVNCRNIIKLDRVGSFPQLEAPNTVVRYINELNAA